MSKCPSGRILRKRGESDLPKFDQSPQPTKKTKKTCFLVTRNVKAMPLTLLKLPLAVLERLLIFLDVSNLEKLNSTCTFFKQLISGRHITTLDFPFSPAFLSELGEVKVIEKKPVLRLRSIMTDSPEYDLSNCSKYHMSVQLALLDLSRLRELDFSMHVKANKAGSHSVFYWSLIGSLSYLGHLDNITRLDILVNQQTDLTYRMQTLPSLLHLGLTVSYIGRVRSSKTYSWLERGVAACQVPNLSITVLDQSLRKTQTIKVFNNCFVERLSLRLPCNFNLHLTMTALQEVMLEHREPTCTYPRSALDDRALHRSGLCGVSLASCFQNCPRLKIFAGVQIKSSGQDETFLKWSNRLKKPFHSDYLAKGGLLDLKTWSKVRGGRWFCRQEALPAEAGHDWGHF